MLMIVQRVAGAKELGAGLYRGGRKRSRQGGGREMCEGRGVEAIVHAVMASYVYY